MSADKRTVSTDALATLGTIITEGGRDAIHLAVEPVIAGENIKVGADITLINGKAYNNRLHGDPKYLGIVDPFLKEPVKKGEMFWLIVYPRQITSLRHVWEHPDFPTKEVILNVPITVITEKELSEKWLRDWCNNNDVPSYEAVMAAVLGEFLENEDYGGEAYSDYDDTIIFYGRDAHCAIPPEFWQHVEIVSGRKITNRANYFSCSC